MAFLWPLILLGCYILITIFMSNQGKLQIQLIAPKKQTALAQKFPAINFTSTSRALMSLSKAQKFEGSTDFMSTHISRQFKLHKQQTQPFRSTQSLHSSIPKIKQQNTSISKINKTLTFVRKFDKELGNVGQNLAKYQSKLTHRYQESEKHLTPTKYRFKQENATILNANVKFSEKKIGIVQGYAVSSHVGTISTINNTRISIATNVLKNHFKGKQVSFFALFEGRNGHNRAEYMREHFHNTLMGDELLYYNFEKAISRTFEKLQRDFNYDQRYDGDYSVVSSVLCVIIQNKLYVVRQGKPNATISMNFGSYIKSLAIQSKENFLSLSDKKSISSLSNFSNKIIVPKENIHVRMFEIQKNFDFILLANEGMYQTMNLSNQLGKIFWKELLDQSPYKQQNKSINLSRLGQATNKVCEDAIRKDNLGRAMSMISIQFSNITQMFQENPIRFELPFVHKLEEEEIRRSTQYLEKKLEEKQKQSPTKQKQVKKVKQRESIFEISPEYINSLASMF